MEGPDTAEPDTLIAEVLRALREDQPYHGLLRLWLAFRNNQPRLNRAAMRARRDDSGHQEAYEAVGLDGNHLRLTNLNVRHELAIIAAIDQYLWLHYDAMGNAPPARLRLDGEDWLIHRRRIATSQRSRHAAQTGRLQTWCRFHWVLPETIAGFRIRRVAAPDTLASAIAALLAAGDLRIAIASFSDGVVPAWETHEPPVLRALTLTDEARRWAGIEEALQSALQAEAHALVLPELSVTPGHVDRVRRWLDGFEAAPMLMVLPGSFHRQGEAGVQNRAELLDGYGQVLIAHGKLTRYGRVERPEGIETGEEIQLLDTPIGLLAIPICLDFCDEAHPFNFLWQDLGVEWLLVPAMGDDKSISAHLPPHGRATPRPRYGQCRSQPGPRRAGRRARLRLPG
ncbi:MAG: hypothetical protein ACREXW_05615 [Gammaproteobacteria bacterium]